jgi:hypothetical protein
MKSQTQFGLSLFLAFNLAVNCEANPVQWPSTDGGNGHSYLAVALTDPILWPDANDMANLLGGHLVTLTSPEENDFVFHLIDHKKYWYPGYNLRGPWTGGYQLPGANEPAGGWRWITGEPFAFEIWEPGQPNNMGTNENRIHFGNKLQRVQTWNDVAFNFNQVKSYVVEFPDPKRAPVKWSARDGGNDHTYLAVAAPDGVTWTQADRIANSVGGYLATITSVKENDFITKLVQDDIYWVRLAENTNAGPWIGGNQLFDLTEPAGGWRWVNDEPMTYTNWGSRKAHNSQEAKSNKGLHLIRLTSGGESTIVWNGMPEGYAGIHGYIIEFPPGELLPEFEGIDIDLDISRATGKIILVCFWNVEQRPSRNCLIDMAEHSQKLKDKGVIIAAVHATKNNKETVEEWIKKSSIPFPVGLIHGDVKEILSTWSVESLPWLILTDRQHFIKNSGFALTELDEKIKEITDEKP